MSRTERCQIIEQRDKLFFVYTCNNWTNQPKFAEDDNTAPSGIRIKNKKQTQANTHLLSKRYNFFSKSWEPIKKRRTTTKLLAKMNQTQKLKLKILTFCKHWLCFFCSWIKKIELKVLFPACMTDELMMRMTTSHPCLFIRNPLWKLYNTRLWIF